MRSIASPAGPAFAAWIRERIVERGLTESEVGGWIGRRSPWIDRCLVMPRWDSELRLVEAERLIRVLGGDPDELLARFARLAASSRHER